MKANAPEKIWIDSEWIPHFDSKDCITENSVEYTRTDAFIDKAIQYLKDHKEEVETEDNGIAGWISDCFIRDFEKYMKGE